MCGRVKLELKGEAILKDYMPSSEFERIKKGEVFPSDFCAVLTPSGSKAIQWGYKPDWSKSLVINARIETIHEKKMFREAFQNHRCVVMASAYFEWTDDKKKYSIGTASPLIYFAGILLDNQKAVVIVTEKAQEDMLWLHERMPVMLSREETVLYLNGTNDILTATRHHALHLEEAQDLSNNGS